MGRPTLAAQLAKAAAEGDMEKVKELAARLEKNEGKKPKAKPKAKPKKTRSKVKVYEEDLYQPNDPYDDVDDEEMVEGEDEDIDEEPQPARIKKQAGPYNEFIAPARASDRQQTYIDENGEERVRARVVPFKVVKNRKNKWEDDMRQEVGDIEFDKLVHKHGPARRQYRPPTSKVKVRCNRCKSLKLVWPGEVLHRNWSCDECLTSNKPG